MQLVALSGKSGTGKDYLYTEVLQPLGFHRVALADHFKNFLVGQGVLSFEEAHITKPPHARTVMQQEGTENGRLRYDKDIWCRTLGAWLQLWERTWGMSKFAVTDVRFPNEVRYLQSIGGRVYRILASARAKASPLSDEARAHVSETALDGFMGFDGWITNDPPDASTVAAQIHSKLARDGLDRYLAQQSTPNALMGVQP